MQPYRIKPERPRRLVSFGNARLRALLLVASLVLVSFTIAGVLAWLYTGGGVRGSIVIPAIVGIGLLFWRHGGTIAYDPEREEVCVRLRSALRTHEHRVPAREIEGVTVIAPVDPSGDHELSLLRRKSKPLPLLRSRDAAKLEPARAEIGALLLEEGLLHAPPAIQRARIETATGVRVAEEAKADADVPDEAAGAEHGRGRETSRS
jgi:hypothetical protein